MLDSRKSIEFSQKHLQKYIFGAGLTLTTFFGALFLLIPSPPKSVKAPVFDCLNTDRSSLTLDIETLNLLRDREGEEQTTIHEILGKPNCTLPKISVREGAIVDREVYLNSNESRAIVAYEDGRYIGYGLEHRDLLNSQWNPSENSSSPIREIELRNTWGMPTGNTIAKHRVISGLGDLSLAFNGKVLAPVDGWIEGKFVLVSHGSLMPNPPDCVIFYSPQMPAYLAKLCGFKQRNLGRVAQGMSMGQTNGYLHITVFAYRKNEDGTPVWVYVSPSPQLVENLVSQR